MATECVNFLCLGALLVPHICILGIASLLILCVEGILKKYFWLLLTWVRIQGPVDQC